MNRTLSVLLVLFGLTTPSYSQSNFNTADSLLNKRVIKIDPISVLTGNLTLGYESHIRNFTSLEIKIGLIGIGLQENYQAYGAFIKTGPKIKLEKSYVTQETFASHLLRGTYIRPELILGYYNHDNLQADDGFEEHIITNVWNVAMMLNIGVQYISNEKLTFDMYLGLGPSYSSKIKPEDDQYHFSFLGFRYDSKLTLAVSAGISIGLVLK